MSEKKLLRCLFPGMDPYLEAPGIWPDFHDALAATIRAILNASLPAPYYARLQKRPELGVVLETDPLQHRFVEIRNAERGHKLVTLIEMDYTLYPIRLREPLPCIPVPLAGQDPDVLLDLQVAVNRVYREGPYVRAVDYSGEPEPPLNEADAAWADECLRAAGLRGSVQG